MRCVSVVVLALLLTISPAMAAKGTVNDDTVYDQVRIHIANDREIGGNPIEVKVKDGAVELTGKVKNITISPI